MNRLTIIAAFFALVFIAGQNALAQSGYDLFQKGLITERTEGDLEEAIRLYKQIVAEHKDDRALVAKALVQMGGCYEKLGRAEARKAYERVVREFVDQTEPVRAARRHLEQLDAGALGTAGNGPTYRLVLDEKIIGMPIGWYAFSPNGDRIVFAAQDKLYIANENGSVIRPILDDLGSWESPVWIQWSPDGRLIAYRAEKEVKSDSGTHTMYAIFVMSPDVGTPRQIGPEIRKRIRGLIWTPDSKHLTYYMYEGIHTVALDGKELRFISEKDVTGLRNWRTRINSYSPNGRWLTFHTRIGYTEDASQRDIYIMPAAGGTVRRLTHLPGVNRQAIWAPDSRTIYFVSGSTGSQNIYKLAIDPDTGLVEDQTKQLTFFNDAIIRSLKLLGEGDRIAFCMRRTSTVIQVADASSPQQSRTLANGRSPELSPDGQTIFYINNRAGEAGIYAIPRQGGTPRRLTEYIPGQGGSQLDSQFDVSPDGQTLAYATITGGKGGLFTLPVKGGEPTFLIKIKKYVRETIPRWSPDGSLLAYSDDNDLNVIPATGGQPRTLATFKGYLEGYTVRWSPDGKYVACLGSSDPNTNNVVFVVPASGGEPRQLTPSDNWLEGLEWHLDSKRLTYHISLGNSETRQAYLDGRPPSLLVNASDTDIWDYIGAWAPDGRRFFFEGHKGQHKSIYVYDEASGEATFAMEGSSPPRWSRDGKTMAWPLNRTSLWQAWIMENFQPESASLPVQLPNQPKGNYFVGRSEDDAEESLQGEMRLDSSDLDMQHYPDGQEAEFIGIRFANIQLPHAARVKHAYVQFTAESASLKDTNLVIQAELSADAEVFTEAKHNISSRKRIKASVKWSPETWSVAYERSEKQRTPDLSSLIQKVVAQPGWRQGNALVLIISGSGNRDAISFDSGGWKYGPMLHIEY